MAAVRCDDDHASPGFHAHALQTFRMSADLVHRYTGRQFIHAVVEFDAIGKHFSYHRQYVVLAERNAQHLMAHAATRGVSHLNVLDVIESDGKTVVVAG